MINIIIPCTPNYSNQNVIHTVTKRIDIVTQFIMLYNSIKKNWSHMDYRISLFHNKDYPFNDADTKRLSELDIDIYAVEPDNPKTIFICRCNAFIHKLKEIGTHRLLLDTDMLALGDPNFDLGVDWQAGFAGSVLPINQYEYINKTFDYNLELSTTIKGSLFSRYMSGESPKNFFPHFNGGVFLVKEELCETFAEYTRRAYEINNDPAVSYSLKHIGVQYGASFSLMKTSKNWKPLDRGVNFLAKEYSIEKFGKENIKLLHYCGSNAETIVMKHFSEYLIK